LAAREGCKRAWEWTAVGEAALSTLRLVEPYLSNKVDECRLVLGHEGELTRYPGKRIGDEEFAVLDSLREQLMAIKRGGG